MLCASPDYLENAPPLNKPADLLNHRCLIYRNSKITMDTWTFQGDQGEESVNSLGFLSLLMTQAY